MGDNLVRINCRLLEYFGNCPTLRYLSLPSRRSTGVACNVVLLCSFRFGPSRFIYWHANRSSLGLHLWENFLPGGVIMIHGVRNGFGWLGRLHLLFDWTAGCVAVTNPEIEELWRVVPVGTEVEITS
ncbi:L,D-transpeptidase [Nitrospiraceae bacterium HYJII51-Mn-bac16s-1-B09]|uniref:L,D-transpeptidase n=2 Tax=Candidatus Manganitrophus noduliformans TaxID=2606439 RepID=A0A7X6ICY0_9BACT|nr:L,D-transpeptidase [Candidatus Manganitrophus noduliformans]